MDLNIKRHITLTIKTETQEDIDILRAMARFAQLHINHTMAHAQGTEEVWDISLADDTEDQRIIVDTRKVMSYCKSLIIAGKV